MFSLTLVLVGAAVALNPCERLKSIALPDTTIRAAETVHASIALPAHCRVDALLKPSPDSNISVELWLPLNGWNGKFQAVGNGGWAGAISVDAMASALREGYATASTDTGHASNNGQFALGHPERVIDFAYRAVHEATMKAKALVAAFYGRPAVLSYFNGCSTGGRQALMEAQRYPQDFDGIVAGAPANHHTRQHTEKVARGLDLMKDPAGAVPAPKIAALARAVIDACGRDGFVSNPRACHFEPSTLLCKGRETDECLTRAQVASVERMYAPTTFKSGTVAWRGWEYGSESGWAPLATGPAPATEQQFDTLRFLAYQDPDWDWHRFDFERDSALAEEHAGFINALDTDLSRFKAHGGKLLLYHGWADPGIAPGHTVDYYASVLSAMGANQQEWLRLFMVPGMGHCGGGPGPNQINSMAALERWRESRAAPDQLTAVRVANNRVNLTIPVCAYPGVARYVGTGSSTDAGNFVCRAP
jgi:feruloyl esterase